MKRISTLSVQELEDHGVEFELWSWNPIVNYLPYREYHPHLPIHTEKDEEGVPITFNDGFLKRNSLVIN
ncbi:hypothetical protein [Halobacillus alkaliphilus]|uniref:hypothetical protein n=1 Tax=Halobacillus alkaliphilus TaxID=396056 RepID=UPI001FDEDD5C|nr:hypothetical protein [Halobacillus alkaliphilus]